MGIHLASQTAAFFYSLLIGAGLGMVYDVFRISRVAVRTGKLVIFAEDVAFFCISAGVTFLFLMGAADGRVRFFLIIGEFIGATLYYYTAGQLVMKASSFIINIIKGLLSLVFRFILHPIWRLFYLIISLILRPVIIIWKKLKKTLQRLKFYLKKKRILLYNHLISVLHKKLHYQYTGKKEELRYGEDEGEGT